MKFDSMPLIESKLNFIDWTWIKWLEWNWNGWNETKLTIEWNGNENEIDN